MRAMPSPTSMTVPTSETEALRSKLEISCFRMLVISATLMAMSLAPDSLDWRILAYSKFVFQREGTKNTKRHEKINSRVIPGRSRRVGVLAHGLQFAMRR